MRVCKNCRQLFAVTGHGGTEYCDRPFDEKGRTRTEIGAFQVWEKSKSDQSRRGHKGRVLRLERENQRKSRVRGGEITLKELNLWLKESQM